MTEALNQDYQICEEVGRGRFGVVSRCLSRSTGDTFAVKSIDKTRLTDTLDAQCLLTEPKILHHLSSPNAPPLPPHVIQLHALYEDDAHLHMILDFCPNSDLHSLLAGGRLPEPQARAVFVQLMKAVAHCHKHGVVHRDIKPDNILVDEVGSNVMIKLADFGSADVVLEEGGALSGVVGTPYYVAPEVVVGRDYGEKVDVWSAGVVLYVMLAGFPPFFGETAVEIFEAVVRANLRFPPRVFHAVSPDVKDLLRWMLKKDVSRRFSAEQVLRHPWITGGGVTY